MAEFHERLGQLSCLSKCCQLSHVWGVAGVKEVEVHTKPTVGV